MDVLGFIPPPPILPPPPVLPPLLGPLAPVAPMLPLLPRNPAGAVIGAGLVIGAFVVGNWKPPEKQVPPDELPPDTDIYIRNSIGTSWQVRVGWTTDYGSGPEWNWRNPGSRKDENGQWVSADWYSTGPTRVVVTGYQLDPHPSGVGSLGKALQVFLLVDSMAYGPGVEFRMGSNFSNKHAVEVYPIDSNGNPYGDFEPELTPAPYLPPALDPERLIDPENDPDRRVLPPAPLIKPPLPADPDREAAPGPKRDPEEDPQLEPPPSPKPAKPPTPQIPDPNKDAPPKPGDPETDINGAPKPGPSQKPFEELGIDGQPKPKLQPPPDVTTSDMHVTKDGPVTGNGPQPNLTEIARELGRQEQKLAKLIERTTPAGGGPLDLGDLLMLLQLIYDLLANTTDGATYSVTAPCTEQGEDEPRTRSVQIPDGLNRETAAIARLDAIAYLLQEAQLMTVKTCNRNTRTPGNNVTVTAFEVVQE